MEWRRYEKGWENGRSLRKPARPVASSDTIPTRENPGGEPRAGIELGSPRPLLMSFSRADVAVTPIVSAQSKQAYRSSVKGPCFLLAAACRESFATGWAVGRRVSHQMLIGEHARSAGFRRHPASVCSPVLVVSAYIAVAIFSVERGNVYGRRLICGQTPLSPRPDSSAAMFHRSVSRVWVEHCIKFAQYSVHDGNTARLARRSDEALGVHVSVARITPSLLDLWTGFPNSGVQCDAMRRVALQPIIVKQLIVAVVGVERVERVAFVRGRATVEKKELYDARWQHGLCCRRPASEHRSIVKTLLTLIAGGERRTRLIATLYWEKNLLSRCQMAEAEVIKTQLYGRIRIRVSTNDAPMRLTNTSMPALDMACSFQRRTVFRSRGECCWHDRAIGRDSRKSDDNKIGNRVWRCSSESIVYIRNSTTLLDCQRIKEYVTLSEDCEASRAGWRGEGRRNFEFVSPRIITSASAYTRQKAKSRYRNRIRLEKASQKQFRDTHKTPYDRVKRSRERKINIKVSECVNRCRLGLPATVSMNLGCIHEHHRTTLHSSLSTFQLAVTGAYRGVYRTLDSARYTPNIVQSVLLQFVLQVGYYSTTIPVLMLLVQTNDLSGEFVKPDLFSIDHAPGLDAAWLGIQQR
ncbi:hypothetical protein PR048_007747 [Dryococelus australis]|uniref:Uncharacterized protein n=1 Tax=Dryococelus australis TaxID=614101 RepID=A0ABQ9HVB0_9NEOP|nr:hypothetical protein PR048_007747 [Dryococelus australis]